MAPSDAAPAPALLSIGLHPQRFDPLQSLGSWQRELAETRGSGPAAESSFVGRVRDTTAEGRPLEALELEHYPGMTETQLERLAREAAARHGALAVLVLHRVGRVEPGEAIVLMAVAADRRGPAQRCCQELLEALKHEAPFWKREWSAGGGTWVMGNTAL
jgi:molybdopterin synthase catalytic subunit